MPFTMFLFCVSILCRVLGVIAFGIALHRTLRIRKTGEKSYIPLICAAIGLVLLICAMAISRYVSANINTFDYYNF